MKSFFKFILIAGTVLLLSALLAPILFDFLPFKFERIFNRLIMVFTLAALFLFVRLTREKLSLYGLNENPKALSHIVTGFAGGFITLSLLTVLKIAFGAAVWQPQIAGISIFGALLAALGTAFLIAVIEEFFFRGVVYQSLKQSMVPGTINLYPFAIAAAVLITSLFYALIHFVGEKKLYIGPDPHFKDSLKLMLSPFLSFLSWQTFWQAAVGLFVFGLVLNMLAIRSRSLYMSIGLHAGCVFFVKSDRFFVEFTTNAPFLWGSDLMYDSLTGWLFILGMGFFLTRCADTTGPSS